VVAAVVLELLLVLEATEVLALLLLNILHKQLEI
jgi:hypothetical protein